MTNERVQELIDWLEREIAIPDRAVELESEDADDIVRALEEFRRVNVDFSGLRNANVGLRIEIRAAVGKGTEVLEQFGKGALIETEAGIDRTAVTERLRVGVGRVLLDAMERWRVR